MVDADAPHLVTLFVPGRAVTAGNKRAFPVKGADGRMHVAVTEGRTKAGQRAGAEWRAAIRFAASAAMRVDGRASMTRPPFVGPVAVHMEFRLQRPAGHAGKHGLRPSAPLYPTTRPDVLKLARAVEDALTGIVWRDDAQVVDETICKVFADDAAPLGVVIDVEAVPAVGVGGRKVRTP